MCAGTGHGPSTTRYAGGPPPHATGTGRILRHPILPALRSRMGRWQRAALTEGLSHPLWLPNPDPRPSSFPQPRDKVFGVFTLLVWPLFLLSRRRMAH